MSLSYATLADFRATKLIQTEDDPGDTVIQRYLDIATNWIDRTTRRRFFPYYDGRAYSVMVQYQDLANRALITHDCDLQADLLEPQQIQTGDPVSPVDTLETLLAPLTPYATSFTLTDVDGTDQVGATRVTEGYILQIDGEYMYVVAVDTATNVVQVIRRSYSANWMSTHASGTKIYRLKGTTLQLGIDSFLLDFNAWPKYAVRVIWPRTFAGQYGSISAKYRSPTIYVNGLWGYQEHYNERAWINTLQTLGASVSASATVFEIQSDTDLDDGGRTAFIPGQMYRVDNELLECVTVTAGDPPTATFRRGRNGSPALPHDADIPIFRWHVLDEIQEACFAIAKTWREADQSAGGRQGVSEMSTGVALSIPADAAETVKRLTREIM